MDTAVTPGHVVCRLVGELDGASAGLLREALDQVLGPNVSKLVFDLGQLTFIDSSGLHELVAALKRQREAGGDVVFRDPSPQTMRVLDIVGLSSVFTIV